MVVHEAVVEGDSATVEVMDSNYAHRLATGADVLAEGLIPLWGESERVTLDYVAVTINCEFC